VRELDELVTELLTLSRLEQGAGHLVLMRVSVDELLDSVAASMCNDVVDRSLTLSVSTGGAAVAQAPTYHVCDPKLVARALLNLIRNSTRYAKRAISLGAEVDGTGALVLTSTMTVLAFRSPIVTVCSSRFIDLIRAVTGIPAGSASALRSCGVWRWSVAQTCGSSRPPQAAHAS
jgi:signal transduction histidine kinase